MLALLGVGFATLATSLVLYLGGYFRHPGHNSGQLALVGLIALYPTTLISVLFNIAMAKAAGSALEGRTPPVREALASSLEGIGQIALWALIAATVGLLLEQIASRLPFGGKLATWLVGAAWGLATIFVVPILALEPEAATLPSISASSRLFRKRWGESLTGALTIGFWVVLIALPLGFVSGIAAAVARQHPQTWGAVLGATVIALVLVGAMAAALRQVFAVVLYRYATGGTTGGFPIEELERPFLPRQGLRWRNRTGRTRYLSRWIGFSVAAVLAIIIAGAIIGKHRDGGQFF